MCLLLLAYKKFPSRDILQKAERLNSDGAGISWIDEEAGVVRWKKGLKARELMEEFSDLPLPVMIHFRRATVGKNVPELTHPFSLELDKSLDLEGSSKVGVLAHNGGWTNWHEVLVDLINSGHKLPLGKWSDSRAMAWAASIKGEYPLYNYLDGLSTGDKIAVMTPAGVKRFGNWGLIDDKTGFCFSYNPSFNYTTYWYDDEFGHKQYPTRYSNYYKAPTFKSSTYDNYEDYIENSIRKDTKAYEKYKDLKEKSKKR